MIINNTLNTAQIQAIKYTTGPCLVIAGAGSGKTRVITHKIAYLIEQGFSAKNIAAITFTNKAANEMQERLSKLINKNDLKQLTVCTFHALGLKILRQEAEYIGFKPNFSIFSSEDVYSVLQEILSTTDKSLIKSIAHCIGNYKNNLYTPDMALNNAHSDIEIQACKIYPIYLQTLKAYQAVDFDDLIKLPCELLNNNNQLQIKWQNKLRYILVDEYQDTNLCQYNLLKLLVGNPLEKMPLFTAVGDDDQAIYGWRGASSDNLKKLSQDFKALQVIKLEQNYRSSNNILKAANTLIKNNTKIFDKQLWSEHGSGDEVCVYAMNDEEHEAEGIIFRISAHRFERKTAWEDYAILYRSNYQSRVLEQILRRENISYTLSGGQSFFEKAEIKDICAYLRLIYNTNDDPAFIRAATTPKKGIGSTTLTKLGEFAGTRKASLFDACFMSMLEDVINSQNLFSLRDFVSFINDLSDKAKTEPADILLKELMNYMCYESYLYDTFDEKTARNKWENVTEFILWLKSKGTNSTKLEQDISFENQDNLGNKSKNLIELTQMIALMTILQGKDKQNSGIQLSTLHAAKGLEFSHVFLMGIEEGILPFDNGEKQSDIEEERRLMYVGVTRAKKSLHLSWCKQRKKGGQKTSIDPSRFLSEMNMNPLEKEKINPKVYLDMMKEMLL